MIALRWLAKAADAVMSTKAPSQWASSSFDSHAHGLPPLRVVERPPADPDSTPGSAGGKDMAGVIRHGVVRPGTARHGMARRGMARLGSAGEAILPNPRPPEGTASP